jgi:hypothetical protein
MATMASESAPAPAAMVQQLSVDSDWWSISPVPGRVPRGARPRRARRSRAGPG